MSEYNSREYSCSCAQITVMEQAVGEEAMSKLGCVCGHVIRDQHDHLAYTGRIIRDQQLDHLVDAVVRDLVAFITAKTEQRGRAWLASYFPEPYPADATDHEVVHDLITPYLLLRSSLDSYQCENCGRIWIEDRQHADHFRSFLPEGAWAGTLAVSPDE